MQKSLLFAFISALLFPSNALSDEHTSALKALKEQGVSVVYEFDTPMGLQGYVGEAEGQILTFYASQDGKNLIIGTMINQYGDNLSERVIHEDVVRPKLEAAWPRLESSQVVQEGSKDAETILYSFTDPNCPYCVRFRQQINPWIESNEVQIRHIMVGMLAEDSVRRSAMILESPNSAELLQQQQATMRKGGIELDPELVSKGYLTVREHNNLMGDLDFYGTPMTVYRDQDNEIQVIQGILDARTLDRLKDEGF